MFNSIKVGVRYMLMFFFLILFVSGKPGEGVGEEAAARPRNIVLIIGDGMGISQVYAAMSVSQRDLNLSKAEYIGFSKTHSYDNYITDSAAGGTAMSSGKKTRNGMIGMSPDSVDVTNIIELAHKKGLAGGVVSTSAITHATPATFVAHNVSRNNYDEIALDYLKTRPEVFIGGGLKNFNGRNDSLDLIPDLRKMGYQVVFNVDELIDANSNRLAGLLAQEHLPTIDQGRGDELSYSAIKAMETLSKNGKGFFLMIEAAQIDFGGHENDSRYVVLETLDLDRVLGVVLDYAKNLGNTLVIVTSDHETGGMALTGGDTEKRSVSATFSTAVHTGVVVPVFAFGPGAELFTGFMDNTEIFDRMKKLLRL